MTAPTQEEIKTDMTKSLLIDGLKDAVRHARGTNKFATQEEIKAVVADLRSRAADRHRIGWDISDTMTPPYMEMLANLIERLAAEKESTFRYACRLATSLSKKHYSDGPPITLLDELDGVLSQIDNMTTGLERKDKPPSVSAHIKPLVWTRSMNSNFEEWFASSPLGEYVVCRRNGVWQWGCSRDQYLANLCEGPEDGKAKAQADLVERISPALIVGPTNNLAD